MAVGEPAAGSPPKLESREWMEKGEGKKRQATTNSTFLKINRVVVLLFFDFLNVDYRNLLNRVPFL